jgi:hypothetical protein
MWIYHVPYVRVLVTLQGFLWKFVGNHRHAGKFWFFHSCSCTSFAERSKFIKKNSFSIPTRHIWNSSGLRPRYLMTSHYTWGSMTTLHDVGGVLGRPLDTSFGLSHSYGHGSWLVCEVTLRLPMTRAVTTDRWTFMCPLNARDNTGRVGTYKHYPTIFSSTFSRLTLTIVWWSSNIHRKPPY